MRSVWGSSFIKQKRLTEAGAFGGAGYERCQALKRILKAGIFSSSRCLSDWISFAVGDRLTPIRELPFSHVPSEKRVARTLVGTRFSPSTALARMASSSVSKYSWPAESPPRPSIQTSKSSRSPSQTVPFFKITSSLCRRIATNEHLLLG